MSARILRLSGTPLGSSRDAEFLPAALEILERPPSPVRLALILIISGLVAMTLLWGYLGRIDIVATAQGKIQPIGRVKVVQGVEPGQVRSIRVENGQAVNEGDVLIEFDPTEATAEAVQWRVGQAAYRAEASRRSIAIAQVESGIIEAAPIPWDPEIPKEIRIREEHVLAGDLHQLASTLATLVAQKRSKQAELERFRETVRVQQDLVATLKERVTMRTTLIEKNAGTRASLLDSMETYLTQQATLAAETGQLGETEAAIEGVQQEISKAKDAFLADNFQRFAAAERQADEAGQHLARALVHIDHMTIRAPIAGVVNASSVTTVGQITGAGEELMRIVPDGSRIEIEAYLPNKDVGFVQPSQEVEIKIESLPFTRYGTISGTVARVATDAIPEPDAQNIEADSSKSGNIRVFAGAAQRTQNLVFPVTVRPTKDSILADGRNVKLSPGMSVTVEIKTGRRRILEYLLSPLLEVGLTAFHER